MSTDNAKRVAPSKVDLEQWRSEVRDFFDTIRRDLRELGEAAEQALEQPSDVRNEQSSRATTPEQEVPTAESHRGDEQDRLRRLKQQIAERLATADPPK